MSTSDSSNSTGLLITTVAAFPGINYMDELQRNPGTDASVLEKLLVPAENGIVQHNVSSIFNKFAVFQYSPLNAGAKYRTEGHFIGYSTRLKTDKEYVEDSVAESIIQKAQLESAKRQAEDNSQQAEYLKQQLEQWEARQGRTAQSARSFRANQHGILSNPTASHLQKWGAEVSAGTSVGFQPYSLTDFMFCKYYGKIPNNRLVTLRRYPFPIGDTLRIGTTDQRRNAIPVTQAVTWFGSDTGNDLNKLGVFSWDMPWETLPVSEQEVTGNEVTFSDLLSAVAGLPGGDAVKGALETAYASFNGKDANIQQISGYEDKMQKYQKNLYTTGPYWNRIYGPVNVIHQTSRRSRGMQNSNWINPITVKFQYAFRSFNGLSPKVAALDLISNFINLTYNDAQFLNQLARYYPKLGLKFDPSTNEALGKLLSNWGSTYSGNNAEQFTKLIANFTNAASSAASKLINDPAKLTGDALQTALMARLGNAIPDLISIKSALSDRPVGEWHLVVGNPMNPIFVMGDLMCTNVSMEWDAEIGPDDFPTGVSFTVTLKQGKPRDKTAIERMLNAGETKLTSSRIKSSTLEDTFGEKNTTEWDKLVKTDGAASKASLDAYYKTMKDGDKAVYDGFRNRFLQGYGIPLPGSTQASALEAGGLIDDSLLLLYYQRSYGQN
jgi:hypothetical protein